MGKAYGILRGHTLKILNLKRNYSNVPNNNFNSYLTGLIEGDGCINIPKREKDNNNKHISPQIIISFNSKDQAIALLLQKNQNTGKIYKIKGKNAYYYRISNLINLIKLVNITSPFYRTHKIDQLYKLIDYINNRTNSNIIKPLMDNSPIDSNAWQSGFIDADGHFSVRVSKGKKSTRLACSFEQIQSKYTLSMGDNQKIQSKLSEFLNSNLKEIKNKKQYRVRTTSLKGNLILIEYLQKYPLFSSKYLDYLDWKEVISYFIRKEHYENIENIEKLKLNMNNNRTYLNWDHLQNFYENKE